MDRAEFMRRLTALLNDVPPAEREEAIQYYNDYFEDAGEGNEQGVIASLGSPEELAKSIKAGLQDGGSMGEFTESGFRGYEEHRRNEIMQMQAREESTADSGTAGGQTSAYGGSQGSTYGGPGGPGSTYGPAGSQDGHYGQPAGNTPPPKEGLSGGMIALIVILAVLSSPVWVSLLGGLFGGSVGLIAGLFGVFLAFLIVGVVLIVVGIALIITGIVAMFGAPLGGLCLIGTGMVLMAVGLVFMWLMVLVVGTAIPALIRGIVNLCRRIFHKGGAQV